MPRLSLAGPYPKGVFEKITALLPGDWTIRRIETQEELNAQTDLEYVILRTFTMGKALIESNPGLRMIQRWGAGYDSVDIAAAGARGIPVAVAAGVNSHAVAEHAILLIMASLRNLLPIATNTTTGGWDRNTYASRTHMLAEKSVGLLGCGAIGRRVAALLKGLGANVSYSDPYRLDAETEQRLGLTYAETDALFSNSDVISLHLPLTDSTAGMVNARLLALMKPAAILVNTARGGLIDENALADALGSGRLQGAALDSFSEEPYPAEGRLRNAPNLIMTPHVGGTVAELNDHMARRVCENIGKVFEGKPLSPRELVNRDACGYPVD